MQAANLPNIDQQAALKACGNDKAFALQLLKLFMQQLPNNLAELDHAYQANHWPAITASCHKLRGAAVYCGLLKLCSTLQELETQARKHIMTDSLAKSYQHLQIAVKSLHAEFQLFMAK